MTQAEAIPGKYNHSTDTQIAVVPDSLADSVEYEGQGQHTGHEASQKTRGSNCTQGMIHLSTEQRET